MMPALANTFFLSGLMEASVGVVIDALLDGWGLIIDRIVGLSHTVTARPTQPEYHHNSRTCGGNEICAEDVSPH